MNISKAHISALILTTALTALSCSASYNTHNDEYEVVQPNVKLLLKMDPVLPVSGINADIVAILSTPVEIEPVKREVVKSPKVEVSKVEKDASDEVQEVVIEEPKITEEVLLLAQLIEAEAGNQDLTGKKLVADVVLNRVESKKWPNTIRDVIFQRNQFSVIGNGTFYDMVNRISEESIEAAQNELNGKRVDPWIQYFNSGSYCMNGKGGWKYKDHWFAY